MTGAVSVIGRRVLVVDDDAAQAAALATLLRLDGVDATYEHVATRALAKLLADPPDVVVVDLKMPELMGSDLLAQLRARHPNVPAILLTGCEARDPRVVAAMTTSGVAYVAKPVEWPELMAALISVLTVASSVACSP